MADASMRDMLEAGVHFGHQTRYWNPKMRPYVYGARNKIHIINLEKTLPMYHEAVNFLGRMAQNRGRIMFVGAKPAAQEAVATEAKRCNMPYVNRRWLGGMLTNFRTIKQSIKYMFELERTLEENAIKPQLNKKELFKIHRKYTKLENNLGGIKDMEGLPDVLFVIDVGHEKIAIGEAIKLRIPIVGVVDTNYSPSGISYVIPGNDDSTRAIQLYLKGATDAILEGLETARAMAKQEVEETAAAAATDSEFKRKPKAERKGVDSNADAKKASGKIVMRDKKQKVTTGADEQASSVPAIADATKEDKAT